MLGFMMLSKNRNILKLSSSIINKVRCKSDGKSDEISWSNSAKGRPKSWKHDLDKWLHHKLDEESLYPEKIDPYDKQQIFPYKRTDGGIQYFNFVYYPRPDEEDPPIKPTPLFFVYRRAKVMYRPRWEKHILMKLGMGNLYRKTDAIVCKNIPEVNALLWRVKHLVTILPLKLPENIEDKNPLHYFIQENGEVIYNPEVNISEKDIEWKEDEKFINAEWINKRTINIYEFGRKIEF